MNGYIYIYICIWVVPYVEKPDSIRHHLESCLDFRGSDSKHSLDIYIYIDICMCIYIYIYYYHYYY